MFIKRLLLEMSAFFAAVVFSCLLVSCSAGDDYYGFPGAGYFGSWEPDLETDYFSGDKFDTIIDNPFVLTSEENVSTFSLDADSASYSYMRKSINTGFLPDESSVRIEEYLNYFTYDYEDPKGNETVALNSEVSSCPWNDEHYLVRLGIKGKSIEAENVPLNNYVFLIDVSGSMNGSDRLPLLKKCLIKMLDSMNPNDRVSIVTYSGHEELLLESTLVENKNLIKSKINSLTANGATNGARAINMAYREALDNYIEGGNNRIIMGTDGDFNVGITSTDALLELVENYARQEKSVYLTVCGFGYGNLNDAMMEKVSNSGNGTYVYVDSENEMNKVFVEESSRFITVANDCKAQITFNKDLVYMYRLIGYENRVLANEDFENDKTDAAEIGAGQTVTALYEIVPCENCSYDPESKEFAESLFTFDFRYKEKLNEESKLLSCTQNKFSETCSENMRFAQAVAAFGMVLRKSEYKGSCSLNLVTELLGNGFTFDPSGRRCEFSELVSRAFSCN
ncbi:MAG: von Willebrand factor type A domain-containing protein [Treponema sp.]|nr:von Willebrand factor type A domain-containing protein [Treponema sp.]